MKKFITIGMIIMFALATANAATEDEQWLIDEFVVKLEESGVQFAYSTSKTESRITLIKTEVTAETVDALVAEKPPAIDVVVVKYVSHGRSGYELTYEDES